MSTTNTEAKVTLNIKATSGGERGVKDSGQQFNYHISRDHFLGLCDQLFTIAGDAAKGENKKSGGQISQMLHAYGVTASKLESYGFAVFPEEGKEWTGDNTENWLEAMALKKPRTRVVIPLETRQKEWDEKAAKLKALDLDPVEFIKARPVK